MKPLYLLLLSAFLLPLAGCATTPVSVPDMVTVAVLDGEMAEDLQETRQSRTGWWFSSRTRYDNANANLVLADALAGEFDQIPGVDVVPREEIRSFMAQKERLLNRAFPDLTADERLRLLREQSPVDYGRSLNVDYVIANRVDQARLVHSNFLHTWSGTAEAEITVWDTVRGEPVWVWEGDDTDLFHSDVAALEDIARHARRRAARDGAFGPLD